MSGPGEGGSAGVLLIDDDPAIRTLLRQTLSQAGYGVSEAGSAAQALAERAARAPDLALLDLGLPDRDGLEILPQLVAAGVAVVVLSARDATAEKVAALDLGASDYVTKPFDPEEILARVRTALRHQAFPGEDKDVLTQPVAIGPMILGLVTDSLDPGLPTSVVRFSDWAHANAVVAPGRP